MRIIAVVAVLAVASICHADRLIHIPVGKKVPNHVIRLEGGFAQDDAGDWRGYLDVGLSLYLDATLRTDDAFGSPKRETLDLSYNYIAPIPDASPGISVGIQDVANRTADGRHFYLASTFRVGLGGNADTFTPAEVTVGGSFGAKSFAFVGVMLPLTPAFRIMAEHDGYRINSGVEFRPWGNLGLKYLFIDSRPQLSAQFQSRF